MLDGRALAPFDCDCAYLFQHNNPFVEYRNGIHVKTTGQVWFGTFAASKLQSRICIPYLAGELVTASMSSPSKRANKKKAKAKKQPLQASDFGGGAEFKVASSSSSPSTAEELIAAAEEAVSRFEYEEAVKFSSKALSMDGTNVAALDILGFTLHELGDVNSARNVLIRSCKLAPNKNPEKFMLLAPLLDGSELHYQQLRQ